MAWLAFDTCQTLPHVIRIVTVGSMFRKNLGSLPYHKPAIDLAAEDVNRDYNSTLRLELSYVRGDPSTDCFGLSDDTAWMAAQWYYKQKPKDTEGGIVIMSPSIV